MAHRQLYDGFWVQTLEEIRNRQRHGLYFSRDQQLWMLDQWLVDDFDRYLPGPREFFAATKPILAHDVLVGLFRETLKVLVEDTQAAVKQALHRLQGESYLSRLKWSRIRAGDPFDPQNYPAVPEKRDWERIVRRCAIEEMGEWPTDEIIEYLIHVRDESNYLNGLLDKLQNRLRILADEARQYPDRRGLAFLTPEGFQGRRRDRRI